MEIPDNTMIQIGILIMSIIGGTVSYLLKTLIKELKYFKNEISDVKTSLLKIAMVVSTCKNCPQVERDTFESLEPK